MKITETLLQLRDEKYKAFQCKLMPTVNKDSVLGVRTPLLRQLARKLSREGSANAFMTQLPHTYYEENNLHAFLIEQIRDFPRCIDALERFLPFVDNWATCDSLRPKCVKNNKEKLLLHIKNWLGSDHEYSVRFGIGMLMVHYLENDFDPVFLELVATVHREEYYVRMMVAWYFATALAKRYDAAIRYLEEERLSSWVHNKTIQKAIESYQLSVAQKDYLRMLKRK